jgi:hypothetical protein
MENAMASEEIKNKKTKINAFPLTISSPRGS